MYNSKPSKWSKGIIIRGYKNLKGYDYEVSLVEKFSNREATKKLIIKDGEVIEKDIDIDIIGDGTPEGFVFKGLYINKRKKIKE